MLKKLKLLLTSPKGSLFRLTLKALVFSLFLYLVVASQNYILFGILFVFSAFYFYFRPFLNTGYFFSSFLILLLISLLTVYNAEISGFLLLILCGLFGFIFWLVLGIKNLIFINREPLYSLLSGFLFLALFLLFFSSDKSSFFVFKYLGTGLIMFFLFKEFFVFLNSKGFIALILSFLMLQFIWIISFLPIGFLNASSLALLIMFILEDFFINHFARRLNQRMIMRNITIFLVLALLIFAASIWSI